MKPNLLIDIIILLHKDLLKYPVFTKCFQALQIVYGNRYFNKVFTQLCILT